MNAENRSELELKEQTFLFTKEPSAIVKQTDVEIQRSSLQSGVKDEEFWKNHADLDEFPKIPNKENIEIRIWRNRKIHINKVLLPLRISQFLWFASGDLCSSFISLLLTHRGLRLTDFSSIFSMIFLFQLAVAYISGIIADKLGNAKPLLLYNMLAMLASLIGLLLSPDVRDRSCYEHNINVTCFSDFNNASVLEYCKSTCTNKTNYFADESVYNNNNNSIAFSNRSGISINEILEGAINTNDTVIFCNEMCSCFDKFQTVCMHAPKFGLKMLYSFLILFFYSHWSTSYRFLDFAALSLGKEHNSDFGIFRFFGMLGAVFSAVLCSIVLNIDESGTKISYDNVFWLAVLFYVVAVVSAYNIRIVRLPAGINLTKKTLKMFTNIEIMSVVLIAFVAGIGFSFNTFYHLWFLDRLKAPKIIFGIHVMISPLYSLPFLLTSKWWMKKLGSKKIFIFSLLNYAISSVSYSFLYYPWLSLVIEITKVFYFHLFWVALVTHCHEIAPAGFAATLNALAGTVHFGIGRSFSVSVGGYLISIFGARTTYRILTGFFLSIAILYSTFLYIRRLFSKKDHEQRGKCPEETRNLRENEA